MKALSALSCLILAAATSGLAAQTPVATAADAPDLKRGRLLFIHCRACHDVKAGLPHKVGPNLNGMMGRKAGTAAGFTQYSPALRAWGQTWDVALLDKWIEKPSSGRARRLDGVCRSDPDARSCCPDQLSAGRVPGADPLAACRTTLFAT